MKICQIQDDGEGHIYRDEEQMVPYYVKGDLWIGYDDEDSVRNKVNNVVCLGKICLVDVIRKI